MNCYNKSRSTRVNMCNSSLRVLVPSFISELLHLPVYIPPVPWYDNPTVNYYGEKTMKQAAPEDSSLEGYNDGSTLVIGCCNDE